MMCPLEFLLFWGLTDFKEQYLYINLCFRLGKTAAGNLCDVRTSFWWETVSRMEESGDCQSPEVEQSASRMTVVFGIPFCCL
jgi:hypothetical protein